MIGWPYGSGYRKQLAKKNGGQTVAAHLPALPFMQQLNMVEINGCRQKQDGPVESRVFVMTRRTES